MKPYDPSKLPQIAATELTKLAKLIVSAPSPDSFCLPFETGNLDPNPKSPPLDLMKKAESWKNGKKAQPFIYYIQFQRDASREEKNDASTKFSEAKAAKRDGRAYARSNKRSSRCWYVGSSSNIVRRFNDHLGYGPQGTYALHLSSWARELSIPLEIVVLRYDVEGYEVELRENVIGALEDALWTTLNPMFGRKGRR